MSGVSSSTTARAGDWLAWWQWNRARRRLDQWVRTLIERRPYTIRFETGKGSFVNFSTREIVVEPNFPAGLSLPARSIPTSWGRSRVLRASTLEVLCARALAYHEGSHVLWTDVVPLQGSTHAWLVNAMEDERIERLTAATYAPASRDFAELGHRMWLDGWKPAEDRITALLNACLFARWDHERPTDSPSRIIISDAADVTLWQTAVVPLVRQAWVAPSTAHVASIALEILKLIGLPADDAAETHGRDGRDLLGGVVRDVRGERHVDDRPISGMLVVDGPPADPDDDPDTENVLLDSRVADTDPSAGHLWMQPFQTLQSGVMGSVRRLATELRVVHPRYGADRQ